MFDPSAYPPAFSALLKDFSREIAGVAARAGWEQETRHLLTRYTLAACLLARRDMDLAPILRRSFYQLESIGMRVICSKTCADWEDRIMLVALLAIQEIGAEMKDAETYERQLTNNVHALYSRAMNRRSFFRDTGNIIETQLTEAWKSGADEMMVLPEDMTAEDNAYIQKLISDERKYLDGFADDIQNAAGDQAGWEKFKPRIGMWVNRIKDVENQARIYFGGKQRLIWRYGPTEHCDDCRRLNGIVAFAREWQQSGVHPQSRDLKCHGVNCQCTCTPTSQRRTPKALDKIKAIMGAGSSKSFPGHAGRPGMVGGSRPRSGGNLVVGSSGGMYGGGSSGVVIENSPSAFLIRNQLSELPQDHLDGLVGVSFVEGAFIPSGVTEAYGTYNPKTKIINLSSNKDNIAVIGGNVTAHEVGHHVHLAKLTDEGIREWNDISDHGKNARISAYGRTNRGEHFSEAYRAYQMGGNRRALLKNLEPRAYRFMIKVNSGKNIRRSGDYASNDEKTWREKYEG